MKAPNIDFMEISNLVDKMTELQKPFDHDRYEIRKKIDRGCWGVAYEIKDLVTNSIMVGKDFEPTSTALRQLKERNLHLNDVIRNEYTELRAPDGIVPTWIEKDKNGKLFLVMPKYEHTLEAEVTYSSGDRKNLNNGLTLDEIIRWGNDLSVSIGGYHKEFDEAHCDIKFDNLFVDKKGKLWLGDSGTSTGTSHISFDDKRSNMGFMYTRAPENFQADSRPHQTSDVWSFGSLMYRMFTGKYFLEDELDNAKDPAKYMSELYHNDKVAKALVNSKLKNVPKPFRKFMGRCLTFDTFYGKECRYRDGTAMKREWDKTIENLNPYTYWMRQAKRFVMPAIGAGLLAMGIIYGSKLEPTQVTMPKSELKGQVYMTEAIPSEHLVFERDTIPEPKDIISIGAFNMSSSMLRMYTKNMYVGHFLRAYNQAVLERGYVNVDPYTEEQFRTYLAYTSTDERQFADQPNSIIAKSLEVGITKSKTQNGTIDLEDVFAIARLGEDKVNEARRAAASFDFKVYSKAKDLNGNFIIPQKEQEFLVDAMSRVNLE